MNQFNKYDQEAMLRINLPQPAKEALQPSQERFTRILSPYEGYIRGNMFADLYDPYFSTEPYSLAPRNEREALLNKYRVFDFACIDLGLYLDTHPEDGEVIKLYSQYRKQADQWKLEYESRYGPLTLDGENIDTFPWAWILPPMSWEGR